MKIKEGQKKCEAREIKQIILFSTDLDVCGIAITARQEYNDLQHVTSKVLVHLTG